MKSKTYGVGIAGQRSQVEITNRQNCVEYKVLSGYCSESDARMAAGNFNLGMYSHYYNGHYYSRKPAVSRLEEEIKETEKLLTELKFALKVTKKKSWIKVD